jgi:2'-5' RNA ligase
VNFNVNTIKSARSIQAHSYGCLMAPLPSISDRIHTFADAIPEEFIYDDGSGEQGRQDEIHITVKYGMHTSDSDEVAEKISGWPPFYVTLGKVSVFHGDNDYVVLKLSAQSRDLVALNRYVSRVFDVTDTYPDYKPHITIAYLTKNYKNPYYYRDFYTDEFAGQRVKVTELEFSPAEGPKIIIPLGDVRLQAMQLLGMAKDVLTAGGRYALR